MLYTATKRLLKGILFHGQPDVALITTTWRVWIMIALHNFYYPILEKILMKASEEHTIQTNVHVPSDQLNKGGTIFT